jgi:transcriptional regulator CtsR
MILAMLEESGNAEIQRNELAQSLGCVPSQINYVIASRFTPEQGYIVESRRGGGGYIRIRRARLERGAVFMHLLNVIGGRIDEASCRAHVENLLREGILHPEAAALCCAATADTALRTLPAGDIRDAVRAGIFKQMLLVVPRTDENNP